MSAIVGYVVSFILACLAILGLVPNQEMQPVPLLDQQVQHQNTADFSAAPLTGTAPLSVSFAIARPTDWPAVGSYSGDKYQMKIEYGDGKSDFVIPGDCHACGAEYMYASAGTYHAALTKYSDYPNDPQAVRMVTILVSNGSQSTVSADTKNISVIAPNGGEVFKAGEPITITWSGENRSTFVALRGDPNQPYCANAVPLAGDVVGNTFTINGESTTGISDHNTCRFKIHLVSNTLSGMNTDVSTESVNYFTIVAE